MIAQIKGFKIKKSIAAKDKITITFEGKSDELATMDGKSLSNSMKELSTAAYLDLSVSIAVDASIITPEMAEEEQEENRGADSTNR